MNRLPGDLHIVSYLDLTKQARIEELRAAAQDELARANRIATVGAFSASIAHELNQPIASMVIDAQTGLRWLQREQPDAQAAERALGRLSRTAQRVAGIVKRTRDNIVASSRQAESIDLNGLLIETAELLDRDMQRAGVTLTLSCEPSLPIIQGDPIELQQVLVNLASNAADATQEGGGERRVEVSIRRLAADICVEVTDSGPGIAEENLSRLFDPFFTTKASGIGMGLQICRTAVEAHGGKIFAGNRIEGGAIFSFTLPIAPQVEAA